jgi:hypothetical protein
MFYSKYHHLGISSFFLPICIPCGLLPLSRLIIRNSHGMFRLEGRKMIFQDVYNTRSLILKEKISDKVLEVFVLFLLILNIIIIILFMSLCFTERQNWVYTFFFFYLE